MQPIRQRVAILATGLGLGASFVSARYLDDQSLHHLPTVVSLVFLWFAAGRRWLSDFAIALILIFIGFHIIGARYVYSNVPYVEWVEALWPKLAEPLSSDRNHYDRFVHFAFGTLATLFAVEILRTRSTSPRFVGSVVGVTAVLALSAIYEIFEWLLTLTVSPDLALRYNGQQGDLWDAQKDMALATVGSLLGMGLAWILRLKAIEATGARAD